MVLVIATEAYPVHALRRLFSRIGFVLLPLSIVFIRYTTLGRGWDAFGAVANVGVSNNKNSLGLIVYLMSLGALWNIRSLILDKKTFNRSRRLIAQGALLACGLALLWTAHSSTSVACFGLGSILMLATGMRAIGTRTARVHVLCLSMLVVGTLALLLGGTGDVAGALGRQSTLTGRTDIWAAVIPTVPNTMIGAGFDSFWNSHGAELFAENLNTNSHWYHAERINEAHDGYIEVYLNLGWIGVSLIALLLVTGYRRACKAFRRNPEVASLMLAYIITASFYNITEAGFRTLNPMWIFVLLSLVMVSGINGGLIEGNSIEVRGTRRSREMDSGKVLAATYQDEQVGYEGSESSPPLSIGQAMFRGRDTGWARAEKSAEELTQRQ
jgi:O-antigen ligase